MSKLATYKISYTTLFYRGTAGNKDTYNVLYRGFTNHHIQKSHAPNSKNLFPFRDPIAVVITTPYNDNNQISNPTRKIGNANS